MTGTSVGVGANDIGICLADKNSARIYHAAYVINESAKIIHIVSLFRSIISKGCDLLNPISDINAGLGVTFHNFSADLLLDTPWGGSSDPPASDYNDYISTKLSLSWCF